MKKYENFVVFISCPTLNKYESTFSSLHGCENLLSVLYQNMPKSSLTSTHFFYVQVTKLDRDPSSGTALQEISFWLNLERALLKIQDKRESLEVALTLDVLKHGKRFHATVSFDTDTGKLHQGRRIMRGRKSWFCRV